MQYRLIQHKESKRIFLLKDDGNRIYAQLIETDDEVDDDCYKEQLLATYKNSDFVYTSEAIQCLMNPNMVDDVLLKTDNSNTVILGSNVLGINKILNYNEDEITKLTKENNLLKQIIAQLKTTINNIKD